MKTYFSKYFESDVKQRAVNPNYNNFSACFLDHEYKVEKKNQKDIQFPFRKFSSKKHLKAIILRSHIKY